MYNTIMAIDDVMFDTEYAVLESMYESYEKAYIILENYNGTDVEALQLFQETNTDKNTDDDKFHFRQIDEKTGQKESILISLWKLIPRLIEHIKKTIAKRNEEKAKQLTDGDKMSKAISDLGEIIKSFDPNSKSKRQRKKEQYTEMKVHARAYRKFRIHRFLKISGIVLGAGFTAGSTLNLACGDKIIKIDELGNIVKQKKEGFTDKIHATINESIGARLDAMEKSITATGNKVNELAAKVDEMAEKVITFIKNLFAKIMKKFRISINNYEELTDNILCKIDFDDKSFKCSLNLDEWDAFIKKSINFFKEALHFINRGIKSDGTVIKPKDDNNTVLRDKSNLTQKTGFGAFQKSLTRQVNDIISSIEKTIKNSIVKYNSCEEFVKKAQKTQSGINELIAIAQKVNKEYDPLVKNANTSSADPERTKVLRIIQNQTLSIIDTANSLETAVQAVEMYLASTIDLSNTAIGDDNKDD